MAPSAARRALAGPDPDRPVPPEVTPALSQEVACLRTGPGERSAPSLGPQSPLLPPATSTMLPPACSLLLLASLTTSLAQEYEGLRHSDYQQAHPPPQPYQAQQVPRHPSPPYLAKEAPRPKRNPILTVEQEKVKSDELNKPPPKPFAYQYGGLDAGGLLSIKQESQDDDGVVTGEYRVQLPDGRLQVVTYVADADNGFRSQVCYDCHCSCL